MRPAGRAEVAPAEVVQVRSEQEIRERLAAITAELERSPKQSRLIVLYNRQQALLWALGEADDGIE